MPARTPAADTATRIQAVALELFATHGERVFDWRRRIMTLLVGPEPTLAAQTRAIVAIGGLADCTVMFPHVPAEELRVAAVDAACAALGLPVEHV